MIDLGYVLRSAWRIGWRHKRLWLLGFAASLGVAGLRTGLASRVVWERAAGELPPDLGFAFVRFLNSPYAAVLTVLAILLLGGGAIALAVLNAVGRGALVDQVRAAEERGSIALRSGWAEGKRRLWPVFALRLILGLPGLLAGLATVVVLVLGMLPSPAGSATAGSATPGSARLQPGILPWVATAGSATPGSARLQPSILPWIATAGSATPGSARLQPGILPWIAITTLCLAPIVALLSLLSIPLNALLRLALPACVLENLGVQESMHRAWTTARRHWGAVLVLWLAQVIGMAGGVVLLAAPVFIAVLILSSFAVAAGFISLLWSIGLTALVGLIGWVAVGVVGGVIETFVSAMWTLAYREMHGLGLTGEDAQAPLA